jgi:hypothetical protein
MENWPYWLFGLFCLVGSMYLLVCGPYNLLGKLLFVVMGAIAITTPFLLIFGTVNQNGEKFMPTKQFSDSDDWTKAVPISSLEFFAPAPIRDIDLGSETNKIVELIPLTETRTLSEFTFGISWKSGVCPVSELWVDVSPYDDTVSLLSVVHFERIEDTGVEINTKTFKVDLSGYAHFRLRGAVFVPNTKVDAWTVGRK